MARPNKLTAFLRRWADKIDKLYGGSRNNVGRKGLPPVSRERIVVLGQVGRIRAERPTRDLDDFAYVMDVRANMPAVEEAMWQVAEDAALDENGDNASWNVEFKIEALDTSKKTQNKVTKNLRKWQHIVDDYMRRTRIGYNTKHIIHDFFVSGNTFWEQTPSIDEDGFGRIEKITMLPTWQVRPILDERGDTIRYEQWTVPRDDHPVVWPFPQQILHWKYRAKDYIPLGEGVLYPLRGRWEQFKLLELDMISAIHTRSVTPEIFYLGNKDGTTPVSDEEVEDFKQRLRDNPTDVNRFYVFKDGEAKVDLPTRNTESETIVALLQAHRDLENRFVEALGVPGHISGNVKDVAGRHVSGSLDAKYARKIRSIRQDFAFYLYPSIILEFLLNGVDFTEPEQYGCKWISVGITFPDIGETKIQKSKRLVLEWTTGAISHQRFLRERGGVQDPAWEVELINQEQEAGDVPLQPSKALSNNNEQGPGVPTSDEQENQPQVQSRLSNLLATLFDEDELRELVRETVRDELQS